MLESETCETDVVASVEPMIWVELAYRRPESGKSGRRGSIDVHHTAVDIDDHAPAVGPRRPEIADVLHDPTA